MATRQSSTARSKRPTGKVKARERARRRARASTGLRDPSLAAFDGVCREILETQWRDVARDGDPLDAEQSASYLLGLFGRNPLVGGDDPVAAIGGRLVSVARRARTTEARLCLCALGAVAQGKLGDRARSAARQLASAGVGAPDWVESVGAAEATTAWRASDLCGDQDSIMIGFAYPDGVEHTISVLIDHNMGGIAKDTAVLGPLVDVVDLWRASDSDIELLEEPVGVAAARVIAAMDRTGSTIDAPVTEDYEPTAVLLRSRLGPLATPVPDREPLRDDQREELVRAFLADPAGARYAHDPQAWFVLDVIVDYRCDYQERDPLRWSAGNALLFLVGFVPRKITAEPETLARFPEILRAWVPWATTRAELPHHLAAETVQTITELEDEYAKAIADEERWGPAKTLAMGMLADGVDPSDVDAANQWLATQPHDTRPRRAHLR